MRPGPVHSGLGGRAGREGDAASILSAGLEAADPGRFIGRAVRGRRLLVGRRSFPLKPGRVRLVAFGKAAASMAEAFCSRVRVRDGLVVVPRGTRAPRRSHLEVLRASHPHPDRGSVRAAERARELALSCGPGQLLVFLVSGGGSSLLAMPDGVTLEEKSAAAGLMMGAGAQISEINCLRKHLSAVKGGRLAEGLACEAAALLMSDVRRDDMSDIASGATYCDRSTFGQALSAVRRLGLQGDMPAGVMERLRRGARGQIPETPKRPAIPNAVIASNKDCLRAMAARARELGYAARTATAFGRSERQARLLAGSAPRRRGSCLVFGGETTVRVRGRGRGGRNLEAVMRLGMALPGAVVGSMGTDGIDGSSPYAGALVSSSETDWSRAPRYLESSNSAGFFERHGGLIRTGPTGTNLLDIGVVLR